MSSEVDSVGFYSEDQWQAIISELPGQVDEENFRHELVLEALCLQLRLYAMPPQFESDLRRIASAARRLHKAISARDVRYLIPALGRVAKGLPELANSADHAADGTQFDVHKVRKANNIDVERDAYLRELLLIWKSAGGELTTSVNRLTHQAGGPLIRFLMAAAGPPLAAIGTTLTRQAVRGVVRKVRADVVS